MPTLYNHSQHFYLHLYAHNTSLYKKLCEKGGYEYYGSRVLASTSPSDIIQLHPDLKDDYQYVVKHYRQAGLDCTTNVIWDIDLETSRQFPQYDLSVFSYGEAAHKVRPNEQQYKAVRKYNNKNIFMLMCRDNDIPIPRTVTFEAPLQPEGEVSLPCFVKGAVGAAGKSVYRCTSREGVAAAVAKMKNEYQVQEDIGVADFLNVQYELGKSGKVTHIATTQQLLEGFAHQGNLYPASYDPTPITDKVATLLAEGGLRGIIGLDIGATTSGDFRVIECNARWNGATYPTMAAKRLHIQEWITITLKTRHRSMQEIKADDIVYDPHKKAGVIFINWGTIKKGEVSVMIAGPRAAREVYLEQLRQRL